MDLHLPHSHDLLSDLIRRSAKLCWEGSLERLAGEERGEEEEERWPGESSLWRKSDQQPACGDGGPLCLGQQRQGEDLQGALGQDVASTVQGDQVSRSLSPSGRGPDQCLPGKYPDFSSDKSLSPTYARAISQYPRDNRNMNKLNFLTTTQNIPQKHP